jgi:hypothetical protein
VPIETVLTSVLVFVLRQLEQQLRGALRGGAPVVLTRAEALALQASLVRAGD